jgi:hypothetical protein
MTPFSRPAVACAQERLRLDTRRRGRGKTVICAAVLSVAMACLTLGSGNAKAQGSDASGLAAQSQNPVADIVSLPLENNTYFDVGPAGEWANVLFAKPVYPMHLGRLNLINRLIVPLIYTAKQEFNVDFGETSETVRQDSEFGLGNTTYQGFFSPAVPGNVIWGLGPALQFPTHTSDLFGTDKWSAGPSAVVLAMPNPWVLGALVQNLWSFAGDDEDPDVNKFTFQYFINYNLRGGWYLTSTPVITANWEADSDDRWTVPFGGGVGRLIRVGKLPVDLKAQGFWYAEATDFGPDWSLQLQVKLLLPK